jgi:hypothetical protein
MVFVLNSENLRRIVSFIRLKIAKNDEKLTLGVPNQDLFLVQL